MTHDFTYQDTSPRDQALFREAMRALLKLDSSVEVIAEAADGDEALRLTAEHLPLVVLMDLRMPVMCGVEATQLYLTSSSSPR